MPGKPDIPMHKQISLKNKIIFIVAGFIFVFGLSALVFVFFSAQVGFNSLRQEDVKTNIVAQTRDIDRVFMQVDRVVAHIAEQEDIMRYLQGAPRPQDAAIIAMLMHHNAEQMFDPLYILDRTGVVVASLDPALTGNNYGFRNYAVAALRGESAVKFVIDATVGAPGYYVSRPVIARDGAILGVVVGKISANLVEGVIMDSALGRGHMMIIDRDGIIVYTDRNGWLYHTIGALSDKDRARIAAEKSFSDLPLTSLPYDPVLDAIRNQSASPVAFDLFDSVDRDTKLFVVSAISNTGLFFVFEEGTQALAAPLLRIVVILSIVILLAMLFAILFTYLTVNRFLSPLARLKLAVANMRAGNFDEQVQIHTGDELEDVGEQFNAMAGRLKSSYADLERTVAEKTNQLSVKLADIEHKNVEMRDTQRAILNVLEDSRVLEMQLQEERNRLQEILSSMGEGLFVVGRDLRIVLINPIATRILGIGADALKGAFLPDIINLYKGKNKVSEGDRFLYRVVNDGATISVDSKDDFYWEVRGGRRFALGLVAAPISEKGFAGAVVIFRDLTREKNLDDAQASFISITSHQLRTPLTSIKWFLEMLMDGDYADPLTAKQREFVDLAYQAGGKMTGIINLLLQIARVESGRLKIVPVPTDLKQLTEIIVASFGNALALRKQTVTIRTIPESLPAIPVDVDVIEQVIQNLLSNANRYANENSEIVVSIEAGRIERGREVITYAVADQGIGISKEAADRIFEKFYRADNALRAVPEGSGLGLSLVKTLVEGWGGTIWFESEESKGTTFFFTIPIEGMLPHAGEVGIKVA